MTRKIRLAGIFLMVSLLWTPFLTAANTGLVPLTAAELNAKIKSADAKVTIVNLWATWCAPCKEEMPELVDLQKRFGPKGAELVLVSGDSKDDLKKAEAFLEQTGVKFQSYHLAEAPDQFMKEFEANWPAVVPTTMAFDMNGRRIGYWIGRVPVKELEAKVEGALARLASQAKIRSDQKDLRKSSRPAR